MVFVLVLIARAKIFPWQLSAGQCDLFTKYPDVLMKFSKAMDPKSGEPQDYGFVSECSRFSIAVWQGEDGPSFLLFDARRPRGEFGQVQSEGFSKSFALAEAEACRLAGLEFDPETNQTIRSLVDPSESSRVVSSRSGPPARTSSNLSSSSPRKAPTASRGGSMGMF